MARLFLKKYVCRQKNQILFVVVDNYLVRGTHCGRMDKRFFDMKYYKLMLSFFAT